MLAALNYDFQATIPVAAAVDRHMQLSGRTTRKTMITLSFPDRRSGLAVIAITLLAAMAPAQAKRLALVIGNDSYQHADPLGNARADARAVADALKATSFKVTLKQDVGLQAMKEAL